MSTSGEDIGIKLRLEAEARSAKKGLSDTEQGLDRVKDAAAETDAAFARLGDETSEALTEAARAARKTFESIRDAGTAAPEELKRAFKAYADAAVASGDRVEISLAQQEAKARGLTDEVRDIGRRAAEAGREGARGLKRMDDAADRTAGAVDTLKRGLIALASLQTLRGIGAGLLEAGTASEALRGQLEFTEQSAEAANARLAELQATARATGQRTDDLTDAYVRLKNLGLDPSREALEAYIAVAAGTRGKSVIDFVEAVADAATEEFERLKEFGIKARVEGEQVAITFRNTTREVQRDAASIAQALQEIGRVEFAGAAAAQADTASAALDRLGASATALAGKVAEDSGLIRGVKSFSNALSEIFEAATQVSPALEGAVGTSDRLTGAQDRLSVATRAATAALDVMTAGAISTFISRGSEAGGVLEGLGRAIAGWIRDIRGLPPAEEIVPDLGEPAKQATEEVEKLSTVAEGLVARFRTMAAEGKSAAEGVTELAGALRFDDAASATVNAALLAESIQSLGDKAQITTEDVAEGLTPALKELSGEALRTFAAAWQRTIESLDAEALEQTAEVIDSVLNEALRRLKVDIEEVRTGTTTAGRDMVAAFEAAAIAAQGDAEIIGASFEAAFERLKSSADVETLLVALKRLGEEGVIALADLAEWTERLERSQARLTATTGEVADAFKRLGVTSQAELAAIAAEARQDFEVIRASGVATGADLEAAWEAYARKAIASGNEVEQSLARQHAEALGLGDAYKALTGEVDDYADALDRAADSAEREADAAEKSADALGRRTKAMEDAEKTRGGLVLDPEELLEEYGGDFGRAAQAIGQLFGPNRAGAAAVIDDLLAVYGERTAARAAADAAAGVNQWHRVVLQLPDRDIDGGLSDEHFEALLAELQRQQNVTATL